MQLEVFQEHNSKYREPMNKEFTEGTFCFLYILI